MTLVSSLQEQIHILKLSKVIIFLDIVSLNFFCSFCVLFCNENRNFRKQFLWISHSRWQLELFIFIINESYWKSDFIQKLKDISKDVQTTRKSYFFWKKSKYDLENSLGSFSASPPFLKKNNSDKHFFLQYHLKVTVPSNGISPMDLALDIMPELSKKIKSSCSMDFCLRVDKIATHQAEQNVGRMSYLGKRGLD